MASRRKSDPLGGKKPRRVAAASPQSSSSTTDGTNGEDLENMIRVIHEKFKRKTKEQKERAEKSVKESVEAAMRTIEQHVLQYEDQIDGKLGKLQKDLKKIEEEREAQINTIKSRYIEFKAGMQQMIARVESFNGRYRDLVTGFFNSSESLQRQMKDSVKSSMAATPTAAIVPTSFASKSSKRH